MKRLLLAAAAGLLFCAAGLRPNTPKSRSPSSCRSRPAAPPTRSPATWPRRCASRWQPEHHHRQRRRRRRHARRRQGGARPHPTATRCCCTTSAWPPRRRSIATMPYDTLDDFEYLGMINEVPMTMVGSPTLPANNYAELLKWIEANKGKINLANAGLGAASHLCGLLFQRPQDRHADRAVQGHRAGDERPARRPGRPDVRPDHQHHRQIEPARSRPMPSPRPSG